MPIVDSDTERRLSVALRARPRQTSAELAGVLGVSAQTIRRMFGRMPSGAILATGRTHRARYALRRALRGTNEDLPVYAIDPQGRGQRLATLALVEPEGTLMALPDTDWPVPEESRDGWWDGLPYAIWSMRPQGYLGRRFAKAQHRDLGVPDDPEAWSDDDILWVLSRRGTDTAGNLVLGDEAYRRWLDERMREEPVLTPDDAPAEYARLAGESVTHGRAGSSAAGEFPKFTALRDLDGAMTPHVIVKFSGAGDSGAERRWADLLVCEHLALVHAASLPGVEAARSRVLRHEERTFLETERFDRVGPHGRLPICTLDAIQPAFVGARSTRWTDLVDRLHAARLVERDDVDRVAMLWWFGRLIANDDMHLGNLSFRVGRGFRLAPAYDMLPMAYAPLPGGEVPQREFAPALPLPAERASWLTSCRGAIAFWREAATDTRVGEAFRGVCRANAARLEEVAGKV